MDPVVVVDGDGLAVEPGQEARARVTIRNPGTLVEEYRVDIVGTAADWAQIIPPMVSVYPGSDHDIEVVFRPPRDSETPAGLVPFGVRVVSVERPEFSGVGEGDLTIGAIAELTAEVHPVASKGRWSGKHRVILENRGTDMARVELGFVDPEDTLSHKIAPTAVDVPPNASAETYLKVRPLSPFLRGQVVPHRFQVEYARLMDSSARSAWETTAGGRSKALTDGTFNQKPILSKWVVVGAVLAVVGLALLAAWLLSRGDGEEENGGTAPNRPTGVVAEPLAPDAIQVSWDQDPTIDGYTVVPILDGAKLEPVPASEEQTTTTVSGLEVETEYCFVVVAMRGDKDSADSEEACTATTTATNRAAPEITSATAAGAVVTLAWSDETEPTPDLTYSVFLGGAPNAQGVPGPTVDIEVTGPGEQCFQVQSVLDGAGSELSQEMCVDVGGGNGDGDGTGTGNGNGNGNGDGDTTGGSITYPVAILLVTFDDDIPEATTAERLWQTLSDREVAGVRFEEADKVIPGHDGSEIVFIEVGSEPVSAVCARIRSDHGDVVSTCTPYTGPADE